MNNLPILKYNDLRAIMCLDHHQFLNGTVVDDASLEVMLRIEKCMQRLQVMGDDDCRYLWIEIKAPGKRNRMEDADKNDNYWYQLNTAHYEDFHYMILCNREGEFIDLRSAEYVRGERKPDKYNGNISRPLKKIEGYVNALVDLICDNPDAYNSYVAENLPYSKRDGRIARADLNRICPVYRTFENPEQVIDIINTHKSLPITTYSKMTLRTYMHVWQIVYEAYRRLDRFKDDEDNGLAKKSDEEIFCRHDSKGSQIEDLDLDSEEDFKRWEDEYSPYHCMDVAYARIHLSPRKQDDFWHDDDVKVENGLWYFSLHFSVYGYSQDVVNMLKALNEAKIGVECSSADRLMKMAKETDWVSIAPMPNKYSHDDEIGNEISLPYVDDDVSEAQLEELINTIQWDDVEKVMPI